MIEKSNEVEKRVKGRGTVYKLTSIFSKGIELLDNVLSSDYNPARFPNGFRVAFERLTEVLCNSKDIGKVLSTKPANETSYTAMLAHHLLKNLAGNQRYKIDHNCKEKLEFENHVKCPCCDSIDYCGSFGHCSIVFTI
ncbi:hypothetical protein DPMN_014678 [Dreissena polymorpha]|uniref:Uncharacterized protein n=1 Tax=Dreissena polymorpha TaxID=45954 RepID=A0A9D4S4W5_DREPO|nr:hypothetical protein DPMN_014678 [Dreissena polymorpha]